jgi:hypothetical protein
MQDNTLIAVIELGLSNWLVAGLIPGVSRRRPVSSPSSSTLDQLYASGTLVRSTLGQNGEESKK